MPRSRRSRDSPRRRPACCSTRRSDVRANAPRIEAVAVASHAMPLGNLTHMTDAERAQLGAWIRAGANI